MKLEYLSCALRRMAAGRGTALAAVVLGLAFVTGVGAAELAGPVGAPTDGFGGPGPYTVSTQSFPSPGWTGHDVTVYLPDGAPGRRPAWFFAHGFGGVDPLFYDELLRHLASHGQVVVFSPYPADLLDVAHNYATLDAGFKLAAERLGDRIDTSRVAFAGHSYGGGAVPALALRAVRERGWGANGLALLMLAPWYSYFVSDADLASFPTGTHAVVQVYEDDTINDHRMAIDLFTHLAMPAADKDYLIVHSDRIEGYDYATQHGLPTGAGTPRPGSAFNALDAWGVLRIAQALAAATFDHAADARVVALGNGGAEQTMMGVTPAGRALRRMSATDTPVPLFPSSRYVQPWNGALNPRSGSALPAPATGPRLLNLSARARSGTGEDLLIAGTVVAGSRPKSLLVRAVGPGLVAQHVANATPDPRLALFRGPVLDVELDDWAESPDPDSLAAATHETGAFPLERGSRDAAVLLSFVPGILTAHTPPGEGGAGTTLVEIYDADGDASSRLVNLSARARVGAGDDILIAGFVTSPGAQARLLIRGVGPGLAPLGIAGPLPNPLLELYRDGARIASNDDWSADPARSEEIAATAAQVGAYPLAAGSRDASLLMTLAPGAYTAHLRSADGAAGTALVELYLVP